MGTEIKSSEFLEMSIREKVQQVKQRVSYGTQ